ncbi:MAG: host attachment protein [Gloeobacterales cyanobacterium]
MNEFCVVVMDGARARFLSLQQAEFPEFEPSLKLIEHEALINPEKETSATELWSSRESGREHSATMGSAHTYSDHRERHADEVERRFTQLVAKQTAHFIQTQKAQNLVIVAEPQMLGFVRDTLIPLVSDGLHIQELAKDLTKLAPLELHEYLTNEGLLPLRKMPSQH